MAAMRFSAAPTPAGVTPARAATRQAVSGQQPSLQWPCSPNALWLHVLEPYNKKCDLLRNSLALQLHRALRVAPVQAHGGLIVIDVGLDAHDTLAFRSMPRFSKGCTCNLTMGSSGKAAERDAADWFSLFAPRLSTDENAKASCSLVKLKL